MKINFYLLLVLTIAVSSCRKETTWNSDWVAPLINDTLDLSNFVNDSTLEASGGFYNVNLKRTLLDIKVSDFVKIPDTTIAQIFTLGGTLNVPPGTVFVNSVEDHKLELQDLELKKIKLKAGFIDLEIKNPIQTDVQMKMELPGVSINGVDFEQIYVVPAKVGSTPGVLNLTFNLQGYDMDLTGINGNAFNFLLSKVTISTLASGNAVVITPADQTIINATFRDVELDYARGYFGSRVIADTTDFNIDFFNNIAGGTIDLPATSVKVKVENSIKFDAKGKIDYLNNENYQGTLVSMTGGEIGTTFYLDQPIGSYSSLQPTFVELLFNSGNSNIETYFENLGFKHQLAYELQINPWGNTSGGWNEIFPQSKLKLTVEANLPLAIQANDLTIRDTFEFKLDQNKDKTHISGGRFVLDADNAFPFSGGLKIILLDENHATLFSIPGSTTILSSLQGSLNLNNILHSKSQVEFVLPEDLVDRLQDVKFIAVESVFNTPNASASGNQMVNIPANAFLGIKLKALFDLKAVIQ